MINIGINGYGRIGRNVHRLLLEREDMQIVAVNSRSDAKMRAHLLKYDTLHRMIPEEVHAEDDAFFVEGKRVESLSIKEADAIPWKDYGVDIVLEATGSAKTYEQASKHQVENILVSAPMKDDTPTFVFGVNEEGIDPQANKVMSNASCTTNCIAPPLKIISEAFGIENAFVTSIHSFTHSQNLLDNSGRDLRRARSATENVIPTTTGSIAAIGLILPELKGKIDGLAFRVPTPTVSICDVRLVLKKETTIKAFNESLREAAKGRLKDIFDVCEEPLVSADFITNSHSSILDAELTKVIDGKYVQLQLWYDNEWAYAARIVDFLEAMGKRG